MANLSKASNVVQERPRTSGVSTPLGQEACGGELRGREGQGVDDGDGACVAPPPSGSAGVGAEDEARAGTNAG